MIEAGVKVLVDGHFEIEVQSGLTAVGTASDPIVFTVPTAGTWWKGMRFQNSPPNSILSYCIIERSDDSGLEIANSTPTIDHCVIRDNMSSFGGGGVRITMNGDLLLTACEISGNKAYKTHGGGIHATMSGGELQLENCRIENNRTRVSFPQYANLRGGGIWVQGDSRFSNCVISRNSTFGYQEWGGATGRGGGVYVEDGIGVWTGCSIAENEVEVRISSTSSGSTTAHGGGVYVNAGSATATNCAIAGNQLYVSAGQPTNHKGGGIFVNSGILDLCNCVVAKNDKEGLYNVGGVVGARNSIVYYNNSNGTQYGGTVTFDYCDVQSWAGAGSNINRVFPTSSGCSSTAPASRTHRSGTASSSWADLSSG